MSTPDPQERAEKQYDRAIVLIQYYAICRWIGRQFAFDAAHIRDLGLREAEDPESLDGRGC